MGFFVVFFLAPFFGAFLARRLAGVVCPVAGFRPPSRPGSGVCASASEPLIINVTSAAAAVLRNFDIIERLYGPRSRRTNKESINDASG